MRLGRETPVSTLIFTAGHEFLILPEEDSHLFDILPASHGFILEIGIRFPIGLFFSVSQGGRLEINSEEN